MVGHPQHKISHDPEYEVRKKTVEDGLKTGGVLFVLHRQVQCQLAANAQGHVESQGPAGDDPPHVVSRTPTAASVPQTTITGETVVLVRRHKRRSEIAEASV